MSRIKLIVLLPATVAVAAAFGFIAMSVSGNSMQAMGGMMDGMMQGNGSGMMRMQMQQAPPDVIIILFESEIEEPAGNQTEVALKVVDKQNNATVQGADVIIRIEKGLPMTTTHIMGNGMFKASERGNGTYSFTFTPESEGYCTIHAHVIPRGEQMHSMMENHVDFLIISK